MENDSADVAIQYLCRALLCLDSEEECREFLNDVCTYQEIKAISQRLLVAKMLEEGRVYSDIVRETRASTAIISRVKRSFQYGGSGYRTVFERLKDE